LCPFRFSFPVLVFVVVSVAFVDCARGFFTLQRSADTGTRRRDLWRPASGTLRPTGIVAAYFAPYADCHVHDGDLCASREIMVLLFWLGLSGTAVLLVPFLRPHAVYVSQRVAARSNRLAIVLTRCRPTIHVASAEAVTRSWESTADGSGMSRPCGTCACTCLILSHFRFRTSTGGLIHIPAFRPPNPSQ